MFDQAQITELLDQAKPAVIESLKRELTQQISWDVKDQASKIVKDAVIAWVNENIIPEVIRQLIESKDGLVSLSTQLAPMIIDGMAKSMAESALKNLGQSWTRKKIFDSIFD